jgi:Domain of unknown function (DUF2017)
VLERAPDGAVLLRLTPVERSLLLGLVEELRSLLGNTRSDPSLRRLFPPAYESEDDERAYRELAGDELLEGRREALNLLAATAERDRLSPEEADSWLRALNDLRLVLGTRLDVQEGTLLDEPQTPELAVYAYLSWLQEQLVAALSSSALE